MKAMLVMGMPESCMECPLEMDVENTSGRVQQGNICRGCGKRNADQNQKPDWCRCRSVKLRCLDMKHTLRQKAGMPAWMRWKGAGDDGTGNDGRTGRYLDFWS